MTRRLMKTPVKHAAALASKSWGNTGEAPKVAFNYNRLLFNNNNNTNNAITR